MDKSGATDIIQEAINLEVGKSQTFKLMSGLMPIHIQRQIEQEVRSRMHLQTLQTHQTYICSSVQDGEVTVLRVS